MRRGIVHGSYAIDALGNDFPRLYDDGSERPAARAAHILNRKLNGARHEADSSFDEYKLRCKLSRPGMLKDGNYWDTLLAS